MGERESILCLYCEPWETPLRTSKHHLMSHFARQHRVLYVEMPVHPATILARDGRWSRALRRWGRGPIEVQQNLFVLSPLAPLPYHARSPVTAGRWANRVNQRLVLPTLRKTLDALGMKRPIVWFYFPHAAVLLDAMPHSLVCCHVVDDFLAFPGIPASLAAVEQDLLGRADLVMASSQYLCDLKRPWAPDIRLVRHAADPTAFEPLAQTSSRPEDLTGVRGPLLGYFGALHKLDLHLCREVALRRPDWSLVMVGPVNGHQGADVSVLRGLPNVHLLGPRSHEALCPYLAAIDVAIMPFALTPLTDAMAPIKVYEALAAAKPIVSTPIPDMANFGDLVRMAEGPERFVQAIEGALQDRGADAEKRRAFARGNTWAHRLVEVEALVRDALGRRRARETATTPA